MAKLGLFLMVVVANIVDIIPEDTIEIAPISGKDLLAKLQAKIAPVSGDGTSAEGNDYAFSIRPPKRPSRPVGSSKKGNGSIKIIARNSQNNQPVVGASGTFTLRQNNNGLVTLAQDVSFDSEGMFTLSITSDGHYMAEIQASGFITHTVELTVTCSMLSHCSLEKMVSMSPILPPGKTRIMMAWDREPADVDIHVMAIKKSDNSLCRTWYQRKAGCEAIHQDVDNRNGGLNGAETVTLEET